MRRSSSNSLSLAQQGSVECLICSLHLFKIKLKLFLINWHTVSSPTKLYTVIYLFMVKARVNKSIK